MSGEKLPVTLENLKAEQPKIIDALINNRDYDPFGLAASFTPSEAAGAINAVVANAPLASASSQPDAGLEEQPKVELDTMELTQIGARLGDGRRRTHHRD